MNIRNPRVSLDKSWENTGKKFHKYLLEFVNTAKVNLLMFFLGWFRGNIPKWVSDQRVDRYCK